LARLTFDSSETSKSQEIVLKRIGRKLAQSDLAARLQADASVFNLF